MKLRQGYIDDAGVGHILLSKGKWALCDAHWFHILSQHNWSAYCSSHGRWYARRAERKLTGKQQPHIIMQRVIMGVTDDPNVEVDHKDRENTLDNREANLRVTANQNQQNVGLRKDNTSGFKGVTKHHNKWRARIRVNWELLHLGYFKTPTEAAAVWNFAAKRLHGEFAVLNDLSQVEAL
jgi:hypothetical protein